MHRFQGLYQHLFEASDDAIILHDEQGWIVDLNQSAVNLVGYSREELLIMRNMELQSPRSLPRALRELQAAANKDCVAFETELMRKDGSFVEVYVSALAVPVEGRRIFQAYVRDISKQKSLERVHEEVAEDERRRIGAELHDGCLQELKSLELDFGLLRRQLHIGVANLDVESELSELGARLNGLIREAYHMAHGLFPAGFDENGLQGALECLQENASKRWGVMIVLELDEQLIPTERTAQLQLYRIIQESTSNAMHHGKATSVKVCFERTDPWHGQVSIIDNGVGVSNVSVNGLGLRIMKDRARALQADITVISQLGQGTTLKVAGFLISVSKELEAQWAPK